MAESLPAPTGDALVYAFQSGARKARSSRKACLLSPGERRAILPFKERYKGEVLRERRVALAKSEILTAYFNYLHSQQQAPRSPEELKTKTKVGLLGSKA